MRLLPILTVLHLVSYANAGVAPSCHESRLGLMSPSYEILQVIDDSLHLWQEYDMGNNSVCIKLELPYQKVLSKQEAENLLERSAKWESEEYPFALVSKAEQEEWMANREKYAPLEPSWQGAPSVMLERDDSPDEEISEKIDILPNTSLPGNSSRCGSSRLIFGQDDRVEVTNTENFPFNVISYMQFKSGNDYYRCTAFIVGPHMALTSGNCIYDGENGFSKEVQIFPGQTQNRIYQELTSCSISTNTRYTECARAGDSMCFNFNYGALFFSPEMAPNAKTYMPLVISNPEAGSIVNLAGYPAEVGGQIRYGQWFASGQVSDTPGESRVLLHRVDTSPGQSGSPVWQYDPSTESRRAIAIDSGSIEFADQGITTAFNVATRISDANKDLLIQWLQDTDPCN